MSDSAAHMTMSDIFALTYPDEESDEESDYESDEEWEVVDVKEDLSKKIIYWELDWEWEVV